MSDKLKQMDQKTIEELRKKCLRSLYWFARTVLNYDDIALKLHGEVAAFLQGPERFKQLTLPRSFIKTWLGTIGYSIWITLPRKEKDEYPPDVLQTDKFFNLGCNMRILIASYVIGNAMKMISLIRRTYERNQTMMILFPEVIPENFTKVKWSDSEACVKRDKDFTESTFEAGGIGGSTTSRHYDLIIEDDLIYASKDDLSGQELQPSQDDIDKAIGWHKLAMSLLVPGSHTHIHNIGTRWAKHDLIDYINRNEEKYIRKSVAITHDSTIDGEPTWPEMYDRQTIKEIRQAQGPYMFATQYLNKPMSVEDMLFKPEWLQYYMFTTDIPGNARIFTTCDLSAWTEAKKKGSKAKNSRGVILTCAWDHNHHLWILHYDVGRFNPREVIILLYKHYKLFNPELLGIESVYYQEALIFFLKEEMKVRGWLPIRQLKPSTHMSKDLRIRALEPYAANLAIHCRADHKDFIEEYTEYAPDNMLSTKDILDALAYQLTIARPGVAKEITTDRIKALNNAKFETTIEQVLKDLKTENTGGPFNSYELKKDVLGRDPNEEEEFMELLQGSDPEIVDIFT